MDIEILTGRKNQIRVHMASINHPIIGDKIYGNKHKLNEMKLHAYYLKLKHPYNKKIIELENKINFKKYSK